MSHFVRNPKDRFCRAKAHILWHDSFRYYNHVFINETYLYILIRSPHYACPEVIRVRHGCRRLLHVLLSCLTLPASLHGSECRVDGRNFK